MLNKLTDLKNNMQHLWIRFSDAKFSEVSQIVQETINKLRDNKEVTPEDIQIDNYEYESHRLDDLPLTLNKDPGPGVKYDYTENSEFARGAEKAPAHGIDSFGEDDTYDPDEGSKHRMH